MAMNLQLPNHHLAWVGELYLTEHSIDLISECWPTAVTVQIENLIEIPAKRKYTISFHYSRSESNDKVPVLYVVVLTSNQHSFIKEEPNQLVVVFGAN